ncbi:epithelial cell adhesion molecule [Menidia menidia]|uniref:(Atlantic silverside) hypothetical protein n=1 Tax=Menidia menidia TaxID=238744 RepID=A0A8S4BYN0_9TELE|nr:unnamed protein product [Menidia menidia]
MNIVVVITLAAFAVGTALSCGVCPTMKWANCDGNPCKCYVMVGQGEKLFLNCTNLIPKCFLMKAEMYRARKGESTRSGGKPHETAFVDNDGIYDPDCENDGKFRAKQCNNTEECWCVNSAGVRRTDKGDTNLKCDKLVETYWIRLQLKHKPTTDKVDETKLINAIGNEIKSRYNFEKNLVKAIKYDPEARLIEVDVKKEMGNRDTDLAQMAYYMEKDIKALPLFKNQNKFEPSVESQKLEMENILVYYVDEEAPTFTMRNLPAGIIATIVVVVLAVVAGILILIFMKKRQMKYNKAQQREMDPM